MSDNTPKGRQRASTARSKTGCITCKIRRLKCGEEKPNCLRCTRAGWPCDGYDSVSSSPSPASTPSRILLGAAEMSSHAGPSGLDLDSQERHYFQHFVVETSKYLSTWGWFHGDSTFLQDAPSYFGPHIADHNFWSVTVPQEAHSSICIRHAIVAFGALSRGFQVSKFGCYYMEGSDKQHHHYALQQYQKAIRGFRKSLRALDHSPRTTLICCLLLACFDDFRGNSSFATGHLCYAREMLANLDSVDPISEHASSHNSAKQLWRLLLRLDMRLVLTLGIGVDRTFLRIEKPADIPLPLMFSSMEEAELLGDALIWQSYCFLYSTLFYTFGLTDAIPKEIIQRRNHLIQEIHRFHSVLDSLRENVATESAVHSPLRPQALIMQFSALLIRLSTSLIEPESNCDPMLPHFQYLLSRIKTVFEFESDLFVPPSSKLSAETFSFHSQNISTLYLIATKCRYPPTRREAISLLLSSHRREWMCDSILAGKIAAWMMAIEEDHETGHERAFPNTIDDGLSRDWPPIEWIPEERRAWGQRVDLDLQGRKATVRCWVGGKTGIGEGRREQMTVISW